MVSCLCSTARLSEKESTNTKGEVMKTREVVGNKTEGSLLLLSEIFGADYQKMRDMLTVGEDADAGIYHKLDFSSERKRMSMVIDMEKF